MEKKLYQTLQDLEIEYQKIEHEAFHTCEASGDFYAKNNMGVDCKNLFLRNKKGNTHYLVVLRSESQVDIPVLAEFLGEHRKMSFASDERLEKFLGLKPGSVTPFGLIYEQSAAVKVIIDTSIWEHEFVHFHPLRNTATLKISTKNFRRFLDHHPHDVLDYPF